MIYQVQYNKRKAKQNKKEWYAFGRQHGPFVISLPRPYGNSTLEKETRVGNPV
jgi:hypothetical protein